MSELTLQVQINRKMDAAYDLFVNAELDARQLTNEERDQIETLFRDVHALKQEQQARGIPVRCA